MVSTTRKKLAGLSAFLAIILAIPPSRAETPGFHSGPIFPAERKHNHASCVTQLDDGRLLAVWYSGSGERKSDDVVIQGAWFDPDRGGWGPRQLVADTPGYPDCNPALFCSGRTIWLFWPTILDHRWEGALLKYQVARPSGPGHPPGFLWEDPGVIQVTPESTGFAAAIDKALETLTAEEKAKYREELATFQSRSRDLLYQRLGWMPRVHAIALPAGPGAKHPGWWILPLYCDTFSASIMIYSDDKGRTWKTGRPMIGFGNIQPSLVRKRDGTLVAYMRDNGPHRRIRKASSVDDGETWSAVEDSEFPNPGAGIEAINLEGGKWALIYNDIPRGRHSLAVSLSDDEGATWKWTRHLERREPGQGSFHYPSMIQGRGGEIHATYTHNLPSEGSTIKYDRFNEDWIRQGDSRP